jgi:hypothetical protein
MGEGSGVRSMTGSASLATLASQGSRTIGWSFAYLFGLIVLRFGRNIPVGSPSNRFVESSSGAVVICPERRRCCFPGTIVVKQPKRQCRNRCRTNHEGGVTLAMRRILRSTATNYLQSVFKLRILI